MRRKLSKKQIGAMGFVAMLAVQIPTMAQETAQEMQIEESIENEVQTQGEQFEIQVQEPKEEHIGVRHR